MLLCVKEAWLGSDGRGRDRCSACNAEMPCAENMPNVEGE